MGERVNESEAELIRDMHGDIKVIRSEVVEIKVHQQRTNGAVARLSEEQLIAKGALGIVKWMIGFTIGMVGVGAAVAGIVLAIVARGGG